MPDPRVNELLTHLNDLTVEGQPMPLALIAREVVSKLNSISQARLKLDAHQAELEAAEARVEDLKKTLKERDSLRDDIANIIVDANSRGSLSSTSRGARFRNNAITKSEGLAHYEDEYASTVNQFNSAATALKETRRQIVERQDEIARLSNEIEALLEQAAPLPDDRSSASARATDMRTAVPRRRTASRPVRRRVKARRRSARAA